MSVSSTDDSAAPYLPEDSRGSSVSSRMQDEYDELLRYAVVVPAINPTVPLVLTDTRQNFPTEVRVTSNPTSARSSAPNSARSTGSKTRQQPDADDVAPNQHERDSDSDSGTMTDPDGEEQADDISRSIEKLKQKFLSDNGEESVSDEMEGVRTSEAAVNPATGVREEVGFNASLDPDVARMDHQLDQWCYDLKRNVLAEFSKAKIRTLEQDKRELKKERDRWQVEKNELLNEVTSLKDLIHSYETSIKRKDEVINNLTTGLNKSKEKLDVSRRFSEWKVTHCNNKRQVFCSKIAEKFHRRQLVQKAYRAWRSVMENRWKVRVEKACQSRAQEVCLQMAQEHDTRAAQLSDELAASQEEVVRLQQERDRFEEQMKKAFMRGVCALNMEAMTMFNPGGGEEGQFPADEEVHADMGLKERWSSEPASAPCLSPRQEKSSSAPRVVAAPSALRHTDTLTAKATARPLSAGTAGRTKPLSGKVSTKPKSRTLDPPMSTVVVERHPPIVKDLAHVSVIRETLGHATAAQFPRKTQTKKCVKPAVGPHVHKIID